LKSRRCFISFRPKTDGGVQILTQNTRNKGKGKGKAILLQGWTGPEGSRRLRFPDFKTIGT